MAIIVNNYAKYGNLSGKNGFLGSLAFIGASVSPFGVQTFNGQRFRIFPNTVSYPADVGSWNTGTSGYIFDMSTGSNTLNNEFVFSSSSNGIIFKNSTRTLTPTGSGTLGWWAVLGDGGVIVSDSISTTGGTGILQTNNLTITNGVPVTFTFKLTLS